MSDQDKQRPERDVPPAIDWQSKPPTQDTQAAVEQVLRDGGRSR
jgi:hypothetical protein